MKTTTIGTGNYATTLRTARDGTRSVRYWDTYSQTWTTAYDVESIPDGCYEAMSREEREAVIGHLDGVAVTRP